MGDAADNRTVLHLGRARGEVARSRGIAMRPVLVVGGYGVFGAHVCRELARWGVPLTIAGRDATRAETLAHTLGSTCRGVAVDVALPDSCRAIVEGHGVAVNCAGPLDATLLEACLSAGCHYADITDNRAYAALVRAHGERFRACALAAVWGCSSLPGISGALALKARGDTAEVVERVRVTLFVGNDNAKGDAAVRSVLAGLGRPITAPQGTLLGFRDREVVPLPSPFGPRGVFNFDTPEYDVFPALLGARAVSVKLGFELRLATYGFALLARLGSGYGTWTARLIGLPGGLLRFLGCSGGAVMTELFLPGGQVRRAAVVARRDGQRMAALPCALVACALAEERARPCGALTAYEFLGAAPLLDALVAEGFEVSSARASPLAYPS
jgi:Saccharopine dehydrogenase NADP binding domain